ncbi:UvrB/UvrC motif-containing protein [Bacillus sp. FJAT-45350]|uniref:UvrB/UvrC motif-containing protein n=1 Tax=Bacillus sp. FJAT-45350 TaxID=2011014 RepID=UPI000BB732DD|nr:UvrB/UvrC motif-containing protein [Bacillus sp. FJAT-45350]
MICQECNQRPATLHFTKIINGEKTEFHICEHCAKEKGEHFPGTNSFSIHHLLSGLLNFDPSSQGQSSTIKAPQNVSCEKCKMTYEQFARTGRFGCAHCYQTFSSKINPILKRVHSGNQTHAGKIPKRIGGSIQVRKQINQLKEEMKANIEQEEFEEAAIIRDQIRSLERSLEENQGEG